MKGDTKTDMQVAKKNKGFTLVELIIVIAIIGILAGVLFPTITGYLESAKDSAAIQEADSFKTAYETWQIERFNNEELTFGEYVVNTGLLEEADVNVTNKVSNDNLKKLEPLAVDASSSYDFGFTFKADNGKTVEGKLENGRIVLTIV